MSTKTGSPSPALPAELLVLAFSHLRRDDLAQVCQANSHLRRLARPLLYRFGTYSQFGLHFPGAPNPYPFADRPESDTARLDESELRKLGSQISELSILVHHPSECASFSALDSETSSIPTEVEVLRIDCAPDAVANTITYDGEESTPTGDLPHTTVDLRDRSGSWDYLDSESDDGDGIGSLERCYHCKCPCLYLKPLPSSLRLDKLVLRDPPIFHISCEECLEPTIFRPEKEFVAVLNSAPIAYGFGEVSYCPFDGGLRGLKPFPCAKTITIIMWTGTADAEAVWRPVCQVDFDPDESHECSAMEEFWQSTAMEIGKSELQCETLRIVNAAALIESAEYDRDCYQRVQVRNERRRTDMAPLEAEIREQIEYGRKSRGVPAGTQWTGEVQFLSMKEWVALDEWEDVFTRKEMEPFLGSRDSAPSAVKA